MIKIKVMDVYAENSPFVDKVLESDTIEKVIAVMGENKTTRTVFVVDKSNNFMGIITIKEIFDLIFEEMRPKIMRVFKQKKNLKAGDIMKDAISVSLDDELEDALRAAKAGNLQDLPVCKNGKVIGELDCFELLYGLAKTNKNYFKS